MHAYCTAERSKKTLPLSLTTIVLWNVCNATTLCRRDVGTSNFLPWLGPPYTGGVM